MDGASQLVAHRACSGLLLPLLMVAAAAQAGAFAHAQQPAILRTRALIGINWSQLITALNEHHQSH